MIKQVSITLFVAIILSKSIFNIINKFDMFQIFDLNFKIQGQILFTSLILCAYVLNNFIFKEKQQKSNQKQQVLDVEKDLKEILRLLEPNPMKKIIEIKIIDQYIKEDLINTYAEQKGNTCGATSVASALNYIYDLKKGSENRVTTENILEIYYKYFKEKQQTPINQLKKIYPEYQQLLIDDTESFLQYTEKNDHNQFKELYLKKLPDDHFLNTESLQNELVLTFVRQYFYNQRQIKRLYNIETKKCSTWPVGNDLIVLAFKTIAKRLNQKLKTTRFLGINQSLYTVKKDMDQDSIDNLFFKFTQQIKNNCILFFHCDNHYSLIFGYRVIEYQGKVFQQILGSRFGQRPKHWIDFQHNWDIFSQKKNKTIYKRSVINCCLKWEGHRIFLVENKEMRGVDSDTEMINTLSNSQFTLSFDGMQPVERVISGGEKDWSQDEA